METRVAAATIAMTAALAIPPVGAQSAPAPHAARFEETRVTTPDGVRLYVRVLGNGPDTVIVGSVAYLANDLVPLQSGRTLIFYDPRSRGAPTTSPIRRGLECTSRSRTSTLSARTSGSGASH